MTPQDVRGRVEQIRQVGDADFETAHGMEDDLYRDVLKAIANREASPDGTLEYRALCEEALKSQDIDFRRVTA